MVIALVFRGVYIKYFPKEAFMFSKNKKYIDTFSEALVVFYIANTAWNCTLKISGS